MLPSPLLLEDLDRKGQPLPVQKLIAVSKRPMLSLSVEQDDLDALLGQPVLLEKVPKVGKALLAPIVDHDPSRTKLKKIQPAPPHDDPDHPLRIGAVERYQPLAGAFEDRLMSICQRPDHRIVHRPRFASRGVQKPE
jgi:hypothetical protein